MLSLDGEGAPDLGAVDALAWLCLSARRAGLSLSLEAVSPALDELLDLAGLHREVVGETEGREELLDTEERMDPGDQGT